MEESSPEHDRDERSVRAVEAAYDGAWHAGDIDGLLACLTPDAVLVNPRGEIARGHGEIRHELGAFLSGPARGSKHTSVVARVEFVTPDVAIVDGVAVVDAPAPHAAAVPLFIHRFTDVLVKSNSVWAIAHIRAYVFLQAGDET